MTTIADFLAMQLANAGISTVYGLPGGENVEILEAIRKQGIDFVLVKNESSACFMAAAAARLTGIRAWQSPLWDRARPMPAPVSPTRIWTARLYS